MLTWKSRRWVVIPALFFSLLISSQVPAQEPGQGSPGSRDAHAGDPAAGQQVFQRNCSGCHDPSSTEAMMGPGLKGVSARKTEAEIREQVAAGTEMMPGFGDKLTEKEMNDLIAYLKTH
jgi:mono/diheme cytochrome c family protein